MNYKAWYKKNRHLLKGSNIKAVRKLKPVQDVINERGSILAEASRFITDAEVGVIWSGMDCDCVSYTRSSVVSANPIKLHKYIVDSYDCAEGPLSYRFVPVDVANKHQYTSRDLAMEAFENGHSHVVYY